MEFVDLKAQYKELKAEIDANIQKVLEHGHYLMGPEVGELEQQLAEYVGVKHCITCANGTDALHMVLMAWGIKEGDAVFVPTFTFMSTAEVVSLVGATPVFTDIDLKTFNMDAESLEQQIEKVIAEGKLTPKAIIPVDLFGQPADYNKILPIAKKYNLLVLEDGAQGFGGNIDGKMACINFPTVVAAMELYANVPADRADQRGGVLRCQSKGQYLQKAKEIYAWGVDHLFDKKTGRVADSQHGEHEPNWKVHVYNQATFIGASVMLYKATGRRDYLDNAVLAADYTVRDMSPEGVLPFESGIEQGIYTAIFAQYMALLVYDCGLSQYIPFLEHNIACGWANRDKTRDICGGKYDEPLQGDEVVDSYSASGIPALMLLFPGGE